MPVEINVTLESVKPKDIPQIIQWSLKTKESCFLMDSILPVSSDDLALELSDLTRQLYLIKAQDKPQGLIKIFNINLTAGHAQFSLTLQPSNYNTKILKPALDLAIWKIFDRYKINKIYCHCLSYEHEYKKLLKEFLFQKEGAYKEHLLINGKYHDLEIFALTRAEYYK